MSEHPIPVIDESQLIELRQYTLHAGQRDVLIELFEREFIESQERLGARVLGTFRQAGAPDRFVWLRGFRDLPTRASALESFYGGPVWQAHRNAANATIIDSDNVLLLQPVAAHSGFELGGQRAGISKDRGHGRSHTKDRGHGRSHQGTVLLTTIYLLKQPVDADFSAFFESAVVPLLQSTGATPIARLQTADASNNFPRLPVRAGEHAFVWFASFRDVDALEQHQRELANLPAWAALEPRLSARLLAPPQTLQLEPTARSLVGGGPASARRTGVAGLHDFDFIAGVWNVHNRRLRKRGVGSSEWEEFPGVNRGQLHLGSVVNTDEIEFPTKGWSGMTVRCFDLEIQRWAIYWINSRTGRMFPPVHGRFDGNRGEFFGSDDDDGRPVEVRFVWTRIGPTHVRWEQAFSYDQGANWETNWVMEFTRDG